MNSEEISRRIIAGQTGTQRYDHGLSREGFPLALYFVAACIACILSAGLWVWSLHR